MHYILIEKIFEKKKKKKKKKKKIKKKKKKKKESKAASKSRTQFWPRITPGGIKLKQIISLWTFNTFMLGYQDNAQKIFPFIPLVQSIITDCFKEI